MYRIPHGKGWCLALSSSRSQLKTRIWVQVVYLGNLERGMGREVGKIGTPVKVVCCQASSFCGQLALSPPVEPWEPAGNTPPQHPTRRAGAQALVRRRSVVGAGGPVPWTVLPSWAHVHCAGRWSQVFAVNSLRLLAVNAKGIWADTQLL